MRTLIVLTFAAIATCGCAKDAQREAAIFHCEQVGITQKDPQFETCTYAYALQAKEDALSSAYDGALNAFPPPDRLAHRGPGY